MSKTNLPPLPTNPEEWEKNSDVSVRVLVWAKSHDIPRFARYYRNHNFWVVEGCTGFDNNDEIKFWMEIQNPNK